MSRIPTQSVLTDNQVDRINEEVMKILTEIGVDFEYAPAVDVLKEHGCKVDGSRVYFDRKFVEARIAEAPSEFTLKARDEKKSTWCGDGSFILTPSYGPPFVYELDGTRRGTTSEDYNNVVKLCHMSQRRASSPRRGTTSPCSTRTATSPPRPNTTSGCTSCGHMRKNTDSTWSRVFTILRLGKQR